MRKRQVFKDDFKKEATHLVLTEGRRISDIAKSLGISQGVLGRWVQQERDRAQGPVSSEDSKRIKELKTVNSGWRKRF